MLAPVKNYDVLCLQMRHYLSQQEDPIRQETNRFIKQVKAIISSGLPVQLNISKFIPQIFNFRMLAMKWLSQQADIDVVHLLDQSFLSIESLKNNPKLAVLADNILFAMRCNGRVVGALVRQEELTPAQISDYFSNAPTVTYEQFFGTLALSVPDEAGFQKFVDWVNSSLYIEFVVLAAIIIDEEKLQVTADTINELSFVVADAAQEYYATATELEIFPARVKTKYANTVINSSSFEEDRLLSDLGLSDFALNF